MDETTFVEVKESETIQVEVNGEILEASAAGISMEQGGNLTVTQEKLMGIF